MAAGKPKFVRLLKIFKPLDYLIIAITILTALIFFNYAHQEKKWVNVTAFAYSNVFLASSLKPNDYEANSSGKRIAVVRSFESIDTPPLNNNQFANKILILNIKMLVDTSRRSDQLEFKNQPLAVGSQIEFNFNSTTLEAYISDIEGKSTPKTTETKTLTIISYNQWPWLSEAIEIGDFQKDINGKKIIEVISKEVTPSQITNISSGEMLDTAGSNKVDITLKLKTQLQKVNDRYIFQSYNNIFIGKQISFTLGNTQVLGVITNID